MMLRHRSRTSLLGRVPGGGYAFGLLAFAVALAGRFALATVLPPQGFPFLTFFPAVVLATLVGGLGPGLAVSLLSTAAAKYFFIPTVGSFAFATPADIIALAFFVVVILVDCVVIHVMRTSLDRVRQEQARVAELSFARGALAVELGASEAQLRRVLEATSDGVFALDTEWRITFINQRAATQLAPDRDLRGQQLWSAFPEAVGSAFWHAYRRCMTERRPAEAEEFYAPIGRRFAARAFPSLGDGIVVFFRDVTEERTTAARFQALAEAIPGMPFETDSAGTATWVSESWARYSGETTEQLRQAGWLLGVHPDDRPEVEHAWATTITAGTPFDRRLRLRRADGAWRWHIVRIVPIRDEAAGTLRWLGSATDVHDLVEAEAARRESEGRIRALAEAMPSLLFETDVEGRSSYVNAHFEAYAGLPAAELMGHGWLEVLHPEDRPRAQVAWSDAVARCSPYEIECRVRRHDGAMRWFLARGQPVLDAEGQVLRWVGVCTDIDDRKGAEQLLAREAEELERLAEERGQALAKSQARLAQAARMEALGRLAGGIAHDFNNVLQAVQGGLSLAARRLPTDPAAAQRFLDLASEAVERGAAVTARLLSFARRGRLQAEPIAAGPLIDGLAEMLRLTLGPAITLQTEVPPDLPMLQADRSQLEAVLVNLANNARDAMPRGGRLAIRAESILLPAPGAPPGLAPGGYVRLSVADEGEGMTPEVLARVTEPFFTTKPRGRGTGLGLAMAHGFAEQSRGALVIESQRGLGTTVSLWLPRAKAEARPAAAAPPRLPAACRASGGATILLAEDEAEVRAVLRAELEDFGHRVTEARDAAEALALLEGGFTPEVLVTDLAMPGALDGLGLLREARRRLPGLPCLLVTGHAGDAAPARLRQAETSGPFALLRKPVAPEGLQERLRDVLERATQAAVSRD